MLAQHGADSLLPPERDNPHPPTAESDPGLMGALATRSARLHTSEGFDPPPRHAGAVGAQSDRDDSKPTRAARRWSRSGLSARQVVTGSLVSLSAVAGLSAVMVPFRVQLGVTTPGLVLVVPVVIGVALGGSIAGFIATTFGFFVYDFVFIPPYYVLSVGRAQNWVALGVYVVVLAVISQIVVNLNRARRDASVSATEARRVLDVSELLVRESSMPELLEAIVTSVRRAFELDGAALLLPGDSGLDLVASSGVSLSDVELRHLSAQAVAPITLETGEASLGTVQAVALVASGRAVGLLALRGLRGTSRDRDLLHGFTNHLALALERAQMREHLVHVELLEEVDRLRRSLVGAVSHDLRTPLATIKVSTSALLDRDAPVPASEVTKLVRLIDVQADRLNRMVTNVLDMTRIQSGSLELRPRPVAVKELVDEAISVLGSLPDLDRVIWKGGDLPLVEVDPVLICQVLANLIDNATRYAPADTYVTVSARSTRVGTVEVMVADQGPGVPPSERSSIFQLFNKREAGGRGGLGLAIAHSFVEAHGQRIWVDEGSAPGARFVFSLPTMRDPKTG